jgi:uncharacterized protein YpmS
MSTDLSILASSLENELGEASEEKPPIRLVLTAKKIIGSVLNNPDFRMITSDKKLEKLVNSYIKKLETYLKTL